MGGSGREWVGVGGVTMRPRPQPYGIYSRCTFSRLKHIFSADPLQNVLHLIPRPPPRHYSDYLENWNKVGVGWWAGGRVGRWVEVGGCRWARRGWPQ